MGKKQIARPELPFFGNRDFGYQCPTCNGTGFRTAGWMNRGPTAGWSACRNVCHTCAGAGSVDPVPSAAVGFNRHTDDMAFLGAANPRVRHSTRDRWVVFQCASDKPGGVPEDCFFDETEHRASLERNGVNPEDLIWMEHLRRSRRWNRHCSNADFPGLLRIALHRAQDISDLYVRIRERAPGASKFTVLPDHMPDPVVVVGVFADERLELEAWL